MPSMEDVTADPGASQLWITANDVVIPMCHEGVNRSQVLYLVLVGLLRRAGVARPRVTNPHGAEGGYDPYIVPPEGLNEDNAFNYVNGVTPPYKQGDPSNWVRTLHGAFVLFGGVVIIMILPVHFSNCCHLCCALLSLS
jgi:hypothetical protein